MNIGDAVHYTKVGRSKRTLSITRVDGILVSIDGDMGIVQVGKKRTPRAVPLSQLRTVDQKSRVTEFVEAVVEANKA